MQLHLSNLQFLVGVFALVLVAILAAATVFDIRRRRRTPPFLNYFYSDFDQDQPDRDNSYRDSFTGLGEWRAYHSARTHAYETRGSALHNSHWE